MMYLFPHFSSIWTMKGKDSSSSSVLNVSRGDSLAYSEDSEEPRVLQKPVPCCKQKLEVDNSLLTEEDSVITASSSRENNACCVVM